MMREIEILVELKTDIDTAKKAMNQFKFEGSKKTIDKYYFDPLRENLKLNGNNKLLECCRIRTKNKKHYITYKIDVYDDTIWKYSQEHETEIQDADVLQNVFQHLGLQELVTIDNVKHTYLCEDYEIVLEEVHGLGNFLEVEYLYDDGKKSVDIVKKDIYSFIKSLDLSIGQELNSGKPELLLIKQLRSKKV